MLAAALPYAMTGMRKIGSSGKCGGTDTAGSTASSDAKDNDLSSVHSGEAVRSTPPLMNVNAQGATA